MPLTTEAKKRYGKGVNTFLLENKDKKYNATELYYIINELVPINRRISKIQFRKFMSGCYSKIGVEKISTDRDNLYRTQT